MVWTLWAISKNRQIYFYWIGSEVYRKPQNTRFKRLYLRLAQSLGCTICVGLIGL